MDNSNKMVKVSYLGTFDDGHVFIDQTNPPIEFPCIDGWMPPAFVDTVREMSIGETRKVRVGADEAYEERTDDRLIEVAREKLPKGITLIVGEMINLEDPTGQTYPARILEVTDKKAVFDTNHEAICKALNFEITLQGVTDL